jgi:sporulation protein YlmC with PRC-barrel domain
VTEIQVGTEVLDPQGRRLGRVERIVVDERAHRVTHLVVDGRLAGVARFKPGPGRALTLGLDEAGLSRLPPANLEEISQPGPHWLAPAGRRLGDFLAIAGALVGQTPYTPPIHADLELNNEHEITRGSPVWSGGRRLGEVSELQLDERNRITGLVMRRQGVLGGEVEIPAGHVLEVVGNNVHLDLTPEQVEALKQR